MNRGLPQPQPSSIGSMVPGQAEGANVTMADMFSQLGAQPQVPMRPQQQPQSMGQAMGREPSQEAGGVSDEDLMLALAEPSDEDLMAAIGEDPNPQVPNDARSGLKNLIQDALKTKLGSRIAGKMGRTEKEQTSILRGIYGDKNVKVVDGDIKVKRQGDKDFSSFDPDDLEGLDFADFVGDLAEGVVSGLVDTAGFGVALGLGATGNMPGAVAVGAATIPAGVKAGSLARDAMVRTVGGEVDEEASDIVRDTALSLAGLGTTWGGAKAIKGLVAMRNAPMNTVRKFAAMNQSIEDMARSFWPKKQSSTGEAGKELYGAINLKKEEMGEAIDMFYDKAMSGLEDAKVPMMAYQKKLKAYLDEAGVVFGKDGLARKNVKSFEVKTPELGSARVDTWKGASEGVPPRMQDMPTFSMSVKKDPMDLTKDLGLDDGGKFVSGLIDRYNDVAKRGQYGINFGLDETRSISGGLAESAKKAARAGSRKEGYYLDELASAARQDKANGIKAGLKNPADIEAFDQVNTQFAKQIDDIRKFSKMWHTDVINENGDLFITNLVKKGNGQRLRDLKAIIGEYSPQWDQVRAAYMDDTIRKYTSDSTGITDVKAMMNHFKDLGEDVTENFLPRGRYNQLRSLAREFEKLDQSLVVDPKTLENSAEFARQLTQGGGISQQIGRTTRSFFRMFRNNAYAADYLLDQGFLNFAKEAATATERDSWMQVRNLFSKLVDSAAHVPSSAKKGRMMYAMTNSTRELMRAMGSSGMSDAEGGDNFEPLEVPEEFQ